MPPPVATGLRPLWPERVGVSLLVFGFAVGCWELRASAHPCSTADLEGARGVLGHGDGGFGLVSGGSCRLAGLGTQI